MLSENSQTLLKLLSIALELKETALQLMLEFGFLSDTVVGPAKTLRIAMTKTIAVGCFCPVVTRWSINMPWGLQ